MACVVNQHKAVHRKEQLKKDIAGALSREDHFWRADKSSKSYLSEAP
jgi:hypothetical protein